LIEGVKRQKGTGFCCLLQKRTSFQGWHTLILLKSS
jgi:hypothetical protein